MSATLLAGLGAFVVADRPHPATGTVFGDPAGLAVGLDETVWVTEAATHRLLEVVPNGEHYAYGGAWSNPRLYRPEGIALDRDGTLYIADTGHHVVWALAPGGAVRRLAGTLNQPGYAGDGGVAWAARLDTPTHLFLTTDGWLIISEGGNHCLRMVRILDGRIGTLAGMPGLPGFNGDGLAPRETQLHSPGGLCYTPTGLLLVADTGNHRVRCLTGDGRVMTSAGTGEPGDTGDDGPARQARLNRPVALACLPNDSVVIADSGNRTLRAITHLGYLTRLVLADPAAPPLVRPWGLAVTATGELLVSDRDTGRVRRLAPVFA